MDDELDGARPRARHETRVPRGLQVGTFLLGIFLLAGSWIHVPYNSIAPGPAIDVLGELEVTGAKTFPSSGKLLLTTASVSSSPVTVWEALYAWIDPGLGLVDQFQIVPPGLTAEQQDLENLVDIEESKVIAAVAALRAIGRTIDRVPGALILTVVEGAPAEGKLRAGDIVLEADGRPVAGPRAFIRSIQRHRAGDKIDLVVDRRGNRRNVRVGTAKGPDGGPRLGVILFPAYDLPRRLSIDSGRVVGPSGGLVFALSIADAFTRDDLTGGHVIGVTGTISLGENGEGIIGQVGGIPEKIKGAVREGATVFLVPRAEEAEARALAPPSLNVMAANTLAEAILVLRSLEPLPELKNR